MPLSESMKTCESLCLLFACATFLAAAVEYREHAGYEKQSCNCGEQQSADDGTPQWRVLLATLAEPECHWHHSDDHRQRRHQDRPNPGVTRNHGGLCGGYA